MHSYSDDIRRIAKQNIILNTKGGIGDAGERASITGETKSTASLIQDDSSSSSGLVAPLTLEILTYDDTADIDFKDTSDTTHTLKTAATAKIIDANGDEYIIETITYADP
ncbi:MAG: hypothetical protein GY829_12210 [Gammaproteobacteria bacterium]|nr:hypothetical protein [Gammaproteobacteria bacterium]